MFAMGGVGMGGMIQVKHSVQECVLVGSVNAEQARALHARLEVSTGHLTLLLFQNLNSDTKN